MEIFRIMALGLTFNKHPHIKKKKILEAIYYLCVNKDDAIHVFYLTIYWWI